MSCGAPCPCQSNWLQDTQAHHRDPINNEKSWLDFAVRTLSREVVRKGRGQETVWNVSCRPDWWDAEVGLPWKNPTANPKDTKEALLQKYEALEHHLRLEERFPMEFEEEAWLWAQGKYKELFFLTSLKSLLGKVNSVHSAVLESSVKAGELKAEINKSLVQKIETCLSTTLTAVENLKTHSLKAGSKRHLIKSGKENSQTKRSKVTSPTTVFKPIKPKLVNTGVSQTSRTSKLNNHQAQNVTNNEKFNILDNLSVKNSSRPLIGLDDSKVSTTEPSVCAIESPKVSQMPIQSTTVHSPSQPLVIQVSEEELSKLLQSKVISLPASQSHNAIDYLLDMPQQFTKQSSPLTSKPKQVQSVDIDMSETVFLPIHPSPNECSCSPRMSTVSSPPAPSPLSSHHGDPILTPAPAELLSSNKSPIPLVQACEIRSDNSPSCSVVEVDERASFSQSSSRTSSGRTESSQSKNSQNSVATDAGYGSDEGPVLDLDSIFSADEQVDLWQEDGSFLLDKFLDDLR